MSHIRASILLFETDLQQDPRYAACVAGCNEEAGEMIQCSHCCFWFHVVCVKPKKPFKKGKWFCSDPYMAGGYRICIPMGEPDFSWSRDQLQALLNHFDDTISGTKKELISRLKWRLEHDLGVWSEEEMQASRTRFVARSGPDLLGLNAESSLEWFGLLWGDDIWDMLTQETNNHAAQRGQQPEEAKAWDWTRLER